MLYIDNCNQDMSKLPLEILLKMDTCCVFHDFTRVFSTDTLENFDRLRGKPKKQFRCLTNSLMNGFLKCLKHDKYCTMKATDLSAAGTPCQDCSSSNCHRTFLNGKRLVVLASWSQIMLRLQQSIWLHENVAVQRLD